MKLKNILIISVFLILITTFIGCGKKVSEVTIEDAYYTLNNEEKTAVLVKYNGNQSEVIIPETIKVKKDNLFLDANLLTPLYVRKSQAEEGRP